MGEALKQTCVPQNLGLQHITRKDVIKKHTRPLVQTIFGNVTNSQAIVVLDGTHIYIYIVDVVEWSRALDVRLSEWCCSVTMVWVQIPSREEQKFDSSKI